MGRRMNVWCYGHWGTPIVVFPSAAGFAHEWDLQGMVDALAPLLYGGKIKLYCPESNVSKAWTDKNEHPTLRMKQHLAYERFIMEDLVPAVRRDCNSSSIRLAVSGVSLGAFYASNFALKFPETFFYALCMSGRYLATHFTGGFSNEDVYYSNPIAYVPNMEGEVLERVRTQTHLSLVVGQGAFEEGCTEETRTLASILEYKGIPHSCDVWGHDVSHDWKWWHRQAWLHLSRRFT